MLELTAETDNHFRQMRTLKILSIMGIKVESQNKQLKAWLESGKSITPLEALNLFGSFRLGARIFDIKNNYWLNIKTEMVEENGKRFARYSLEKEEE